MGAELRGYVGAPQLVQNGQGGPATSWERGAPRCVVTPLNELRVSHEDNDIIGRCKIVSVHSELEAYKISEFGSFGTDFLKVFESNLM